MQTEVRVLLALADKTLCQTMIDKFREKHPGCPLIFDIAEDGQRALNEVRFFRPQVAVIDNNFPGLSGDALAQEILSVYSECYVILGTGKGQTSDVGLPHFEIPVISWDKTIGEVTRGLPIDFQIEHSLFERDKVLLKKLTDYAQKYRADNLDSAVVVRAWSVGDGQTQSENPNAAVHAGEPVGGVLRVVDATRWVALEVAVIAILASLLGVSWFYFELEGAFGWTLKLSLLAALLFSSLGFFAYRLNIKGQQS